MILTDTLIGSRQSSDIITLDIFFRHCCKKYYISSKLDFEINQLNKGIKFQSYFPIA